MAIRTKYSDITFAEIEYALELLYKKKPIKEVAKLTGLNHNEVLSICVNNGIIVRKNQLPFCRLKDREILIYSDFHSGGIYERPTYIRKIKQYAIKRHIRTLINCGDQFQSSIEPFLHDVRWQTKVAKMARVEEHLTTYLVGGNHDYDAIIKNPELGEIIERRKDIVFAGFRIAYFEWQGHLIKFYHQIHDLDITIPDVETEIIFEGGHHFYTTKVFKSKNGLKRTKAFVPPSCDDINKPGAVPGFLVASLDNNKLNIKVNTFERNPKSGEGATIIETGVQYSRKLTR